MTKYRLLFKKSVAKDLRPIPKRDVGRILKCYDHLAEDPRGPGSEKISGREKYRLRSGAYRILYEIHDDSRQVVVVKIAHRREALRTGAARPEEHLVAGAFSLLSGLREKGIPLYLASGTDEKYVKEEAAILGLTPYFGDRIYGAIDDYKKFSKQLVIERILREHRVEGSSLLGFGDGYVEIQNIKSAGGVAVAVASDEAGRTGRPDAWKRDRLSGVGADLVIPDFRDSDALLAYLFRAD